ncbi:DUF4265 domain-containing protein [Kutzneria sp. 744]|uniref:DUF4265 domain-containing protein n=1 Tax=Kutzneria sp. (strain 744) TaxID=345341 RepID=UPI0003EEB65E|nr:DUF4265 domain-containing protein [Kutzneria sp. 744]EWM19226.1 hypothetical protein KUTG_09530 [Kutzneria sp. 744]
MNPEPIYIAHSDPALRSGQQRIAMADLAPFGLDGQFEQLWFGDIGNGVHEIRCVPFHVYGISLLDHVEIRDDRLYALVKPSGHRTLRALIRPEPNGVSVSEMRQFVDDLAARERLLVEWNGDRFFAVDIPPGRVSAPLGEFLLRNQEAGNLHWEWADSQEFASSR